MSKKCIKEKEIEELQKATKESSATQISMHTDMKWMMAKISKIDKGLNGNGRKGLVDRVIALEKWRYGIVTALCLIGFVLGILVKIA